MLPPLGRNYPQGRRAVGLSTPPLRGKINLDQIGVGFFHDHAKFGSSSAADHLVRLVGQNSNAMTKSRTAVPAT